jgi:hypothetical protein
VGKNYLISIISYVNHAGKNISQKGFRNRQFVQNVANTKNQGISYKKIQYKLGEIRHEKRI